jgi:hypothetical protein
MHAALSGFAFKHTHAKRAAKQNSKGNSANSLASNPKTTWAAATH